MSEHDRLEERAFLELKRRVWAGCVITDRWYAASLGTPMLIDLLDCDVRALPLRADRTQAADPSLVPFLSGPAARPLRGPAAGPPERSVVPGSALRICVGASQAVDPSRPRYQGHFSFVFLFSQMKLITPSTPPFCLLDDLRADRPVTCQRPAARLPTDGPQELEAVPPAAAAVYRTDGERARRHAPHPLWRYHLPLLARLHACVSFQLASPLVRLSSTDASRAPPPLLCSLLLLSQEYRINVPRT